MAHTDALHARGLRSIIEGDDPTGHTQGRGGQWIQVQKMDCAGMSGCESSEDIQSRWREARHLAGIHRCFGISIPRDDETATKVAVLSPSAVGRNLTVCQTSIHTLTHQSHRATAGSMQAHA